MIYWGNFSLTKYTCNFNILPQAQMAAMIIMIIIKMQYIHKIGFARVVLIITMGASKLAFFPLVILCFSPANIK
jgi:hypothetical protein